VLVGRVPRGDLSAQAVHLEGVGQSAAAGRLGVHQQPVGRQAQDAQVGAQLALVVEHGRIAALTGLEALDVVGDLALEELGGLRSVELEHGPARTRDQCGVLGEQLVFG
jgi:hypothetical protein